MSPQKDQEYFCDGITDEIIGRLSNISELKVPARTSVFYFKGKDLDVKEIGNKLGVTTVLEGSIQKVESRLRARVQLINIADGFHLWSQEFDREMKDVFAIQDEIALAVADKLKLTLLGDEKAKLAKHHEIDLAAYEACLKGMYYWWQNSEKGMMNALGYFQKAIEIEPDYSPAHAGVALTYIYASAYFSIWPPRDAMPKGKEAAQRAIQLNPMFADGYVARGYARMLFDWDWAGAGKDFKRALELNPYSSLALDAYANFLVFQSQFDEAVAVWTEASVSDPLSPMLHFELGWALEMSGQFERAIPNFYRALELDRDFLMARLFLGYAYLFAGKTSEALEEFQIAKQWAPDDQWAQGMLGWAYGITGHRAEAMQVQANLDHLSRKRYVLSFLQAYVCMGLGQKSGALDWLEKACEERDGNMPTLKVDRVFDPLRNEPRFQALIKKVGLIKPVKE
jgi:serine/threonine-protein kinase